MSRCLLFFHTRAHVNIYQYIYLFEVNITLFRKLIVFAAHYSYLVVPTHLTPKDCVSLHLLI